MLGEQAPWMQRRVPFTLTLDTASACDASPQNVVLASVTVTAQD